jgi:hypothetical protein
MSADYGDVPIIPSHTEGIANKILPDIVGKGKRYRKLKSMVRGIEVYQGLHHEFLEKGPMSRYGYMYLYTDGNSIMSAVQVMNFATRVITINVGCYSCLYLFNGLIKCPIFGFDMVELDNLVEAEKFIIREFIKVRKLTYSDIHELSRKAVKETSEYKAQMWRLKQQLESKKETEI